MNWKTIYVVGKPGFCDDLMKNLDRSGIEFMSGYNTRQNSESHEMFWLPESTPIRDFKEAIGAKVIFRYRLRFYLALEEFMDIPGSDEFTAEEKERVERMRMTDRAA